MPYLPNIRSSAMQVEGEHNHDNGAETDWIRWTTKIFNEESGSIDSNKE